MRGGGLGEPWLSPPAQKQIKEIQRWWARDRPAAPRLFREEGSPVVIEAVWHAAPGQGPDLG